MLDASRASLEEAPPSRLRNITLVSSRQRQSSGLLDRHIILGSLVVRILVVVINSFFAFGLKGVLTITRPPYRTPAGWRCGSWRCSQ